jgi:hypothetical protein
MKLFTIWLQLENNARFILCSIGKFFDWVGEGMDIDWEENVNFHRNVNLFQILDC